MTKVKTFKIGQKFNETEDLYKWIQKNVDLIEKLADLQIQAPVRNRILCLTAKETITERQILFYASEEAFDQSLGELIISAGALDVDIVVFFIPKITKTNMSL